MVKSMSNELEEPKAAYWCWSTTLFYLDVYNYTNVIYPNLNLQSQLILQLYSCFSASVCTVIIACFNQSVSQSIHQSINQTVSQSIKQIVSQCYLYSIGLDCSELFKRITPHLWNLSYLFSAAANINLHY